MLTNQNLINETILNRFAQLHKTGRLAHAYLFIGPTDIGKSETALRLAKLVNCDQGLDGTTCERCASCIKINAGYHPDIHRIEAQEKDSIKIEQIREVIERMQLRPFEARKKIFIIKNIENLTPDAGNALLKTLEEPSADSLLLLTTSTPEKVLDTVKSRCHHLHFFGASNTRLADILVKDYAIEESAAHFLAFFSEGCLGRARRIHEEGVFERKNVAIDQMILSRNSDEYIKKILADKNQTRELLNVLLSWFRDLLLLKVGVQEDQLVHGDRLRELRKLETHYSFEELKDIAGEIVKAAGLLKDNLNIKIPLAIIQERLWLN